MLQSFYTDKLEKLLKENPKIMIYRIKLYTIFCTE